MKRTEPIIKVENLCAGYDGTPVMENMNFEIFPGEVFVIIGGSGCGKSTLLKHLTGLLPPISGKVLIHDMDLGGSFGQEKNRILRKIGVAFQSGALFGSMTVLENVLLPLEEFTGLPRGIAKETAFLKLGLVGLEKNAFSMPSQLSGGMKKRAALARAMALDPSIIFLDEPSAGLDPVTSLELDNLVLELASSLGITFVIVTHELLSIETIADRIIMLEKNARTIIAQGTLEELKGNTENPHVGNFFNRTTSKGGI